MTGDLEGLEARLAALPPSCASLAKHVRRYALHGAASSADGTLCIGHQPWIAPEAHAFWLFAPAEPAWLALFEQRHSLTIPEGYREVLLALNGCWAYRLTLYGLPPSMHGATPLLDRSRVQPLDLGAANQFWRREFRDAPKGLHFGGRAWSDQENIGYFWAADGLRGHRRAGSVVGHWPDLARLLDTELPQAEEIMLQRGPETWRA